MDNKNQIVITENKIKEILKEKLPEWFSEKLTENYSNPLKTAVEDAIKESEGAIKTSVNEMLKEILSDNDFKVELKKEILSKIIQKGLSMKN